MSEPPKDQDPARASQGPARSPTPLSARTGFFKPLPPTGRLAGFWSKIGLAAGRKMAGLVRDDHVYLLLMAVLVGVASGGAAGLLLLWIDRARNLFPSPNDVAQWEWIFLLLAPVAGGLLVGGIRVVLHRRNPSFVGGIPSVLRAVGGKRAELDPAGAGLLGLGAGVTIASGGSVGHEGPTVAIGATVGSMVGRFFGLRQRRQVAMLGAGCAAGLAAAFNAPLAGVIFTVEVVFRRSVQNTVGGMSVFTPLIVAAVSGTFTSYMIFGERTEFAERVGSEGGISLGGMVFVLVLAIAAGLLSPMMSKMILWTRAAFLRLRAPMWLKPALGGLGLGLLGLLVFADPVFSELLGPGHRTVAEALQDNLTWRFALALLALKLMATALTIGSGGMGGVFMPSLFVGACLGTVVHAVAYALFGEAVGPAGAYALVGMGAYLGATLRAPLTPIVMIFEFTHDYGLILPLMLACILSAFVARRRQESTLYELLLAQEGIDLDAAHEVEIMTHGHVADLMGPPHGVLSQDVSAKLVREICLGEGLPTVYVVDGAQRICGAIDVNEMTTQILAGEFDPNVTAQELMRTREPIVLFAKDTLAGAMSAFSTAALEVLPVVDDGREIVGLLRRGDLIQYYDEQVLQSRDSDLQIVGGSHGPDQEVGLGAGVVLERIVVGRVWAGHTLAELDLRGRHQVQVLEWRRGGHLMTVDPHAPLREADVLAVVGSRERLLGARWAK